MARYVQAVQWGLMVPEATAYHERSLRATPDLYAADVRILLEAANSPLRATTSAPSGPAP